VEREDALKALNANACGPLATQALRMLCACVIALALAAGPAMAGGTASGSFTVGIRVQSNPAPALTPEQLNARNKLLYEEQKRVVASYEEQKSVAGTGSVGSVNSTLNTTGSGMD
jgi:hypothetical protein